MPLKGELETCLSDLRRFCSIVQRENEALLRENRKLRTKLDGSERNSADWTSSLPWLEQSSSPRPPITGEPSVPGCVVSPREESNSVCAKDSDSKRFRKASTQETELLSYTPLSYSEKKDFKMMSLAGARIGMLANTDHMGHLVKKRAEGASYFKSLPLSFDLFGERQITIGTLIPKDGPILERIARSTIFKTVCILAIILNTIWVAVQADIETRSKFSKLDGQGWDSDLTTMEWTFTIWFTIEILIRMAAEKLDFICGRDYGWNFTDTFLVVNAYVQHFIPAHTNLSFIRILRVFRLTRIVKVVKTVPCLRSLRTMVFSIINSLVSLLWALCVLLLVIFMFSIIFQNGIASYFESAHTEEEKATAREMNEYFGSLYETMISLMASVTGGNDWMMYGTLLRKCSPHEVYLLIFCFFILFTVVGLLNVVTGIFVDSAVCTRTEDEVVESWKNDQKNTAETLRQIFKDADVDESGTMSLLEFRQHLENPWVKAYFSGLDIDPTDAVSIFTLIAPEGGDQVNIDEFVAGTMKLKGHAKSVDVLTLMYDSARQTLEFTRFMQYVEDTLQELKKLTSAGV